MDRGLVESDVIDQMVIFSLMLFSTLPGGVGSNELAQNLDLFILAPLVSVSFMLGATGIRAGLECLTDKFLSH